jgi:hypothetical protein
LQEFNMADPNLRDFYGRVARIEQAHAKGFGFEASGALGRSHYRQRRGMPLASAGPVLVLVLGLVGLKAMIHSSLGAGNYEQRVEALWQGGPVDRLGAALMQADPATLWLSAKINQHLR